MCQSILNRIYSLSLFLQASGRLWFCCFLHQAVHSIMGYKLIKKSVFGGIIIIITTSLKCNTFYIILLPFPASFGLFRELSVFMWSYSFLLTSCCTSIWASFCGEIVFFHVRQIKVFTFVCSCMCTLHILSYYIILLWFIVVVVCWSACLRFWD